MGYRSSRTYGEARIGRASLTVIIDCCTREILGWRLSDNGSSKCPGRSADLLSGGARTRSVTVRIALRQRLGLQQQTLHRHGKGICTHSEFHVALHTGAKRPDGALLQILEGGAHLAGIGSSR